MDSDRECWLLELYFTVEYLAVEGADGNRRESSGNDRAMEWRRVEGGRRISVEKSTNWIIRVEESGGEGAEMNPYFIRSRGRRYRRTESIRRRLRRNRKPSAGIFSTFFAFAIAHSMSDPSKLSSSLQPRSNFNFFFFL